MRIRRIEFAPKLLFRVAWCDFVDRIAANPEHTIHEIARNLTKQQESMLITGDLVGFQVLPEEFSGRKFHESC